MDHSTLPSRILVLDAVFHDWKTAERMPFRQSFDTRESGARREQQQ